MTERALPTASYAQQKKQRALWLVILLCITVAGLFLCATIGSVSIGLSSVWQGIVGLIKGQVTDTESLIASMRLGRIGAAFLAGASLALAGCLMQALLRNPLADPYILGVSGGASVGAIAILFFSAACFAINIAALTGAAIITVCLYLLSRRSFGSLHGTTQILLTGVMLAFGCGALVTLMLTLAPPHDLRGMVFWLIGDLSGTPFSLAQLLLLMVVLCWSWYQGSAINLLSRQSDMAAALGVPVASLQKTLFALSAILTAIAVAEAGCISFVGMTVPHICRRIWGADHRWLVPASTLLGGLFLIVADTLARSLFAPVQLPVGAVTALIGAPVFLYQLRKGGL
ncbi:MAG: iron ABC transporter permease [Oxalobacter sp.]|nr:iron ABC transporter permease [Oxalobacter sp.]